MKRSGRIVPLVIVLAAVSVTNAQAQLPDNLQHWLQPLSNCRSLSCIIRNIPSKPQPSRPIIRPWVPADNTGPITTTPEPLTMALLGTGLAGIGLAARRRKQENDGEPG